MLHRYPHQFSGGQRQRICIARALAVQPKFVVCDECVSALDVSIQSQIINLLQELKEKQHLTYMFISHDLSVVKFISDRIAVMYLGSIVELADKNTIFSDPRHPYTVALLSSIPTTEPDSADKERIILEGNIPSPVNPPAGCKFCTRCYMATDKCRRVSPPLVEIEPNHFCACHYPERKIDENKNFLFDVKTTKTEG
jgi:peptide/nickel transport system ATP-binding protein